MSDSSHEDYEARFVHPLIIHIYLCHLILIEKIRAEGYWQITNIAGLWYCAYFPITASGYWGLMKIEPYWWITDLIFVPCIAFNVIRIWQVRKKMKRLYAADDELHRIQQRLDLHSLEQLEAVMREVLPELHFEIEKVE